MRGRGGGHVTAGLVLAAGEATRYGGRKQLAELDGAPMLEHVLRTMTGAGLGRVVVVLGSHAEEVAAAVDLHGAEAVVCQRWADGQSASLACGLAELEDADAVLIVLGDQPRVSPEAVQRVLAAGGPAARATYDGRPGHPVLVSQELFRRLRNMTGDQSARNVLMSAGVVDVPCDDLGGGEDVDTPEELDALRAGGAP
jgi:CTP:molybdopterin cytidylyltransferase MocA